MNYIFLIPAVILLYFFFYYAVGSILLHLFPRTEFSVPQTLILGFFLYFFLFSVVALPMKLLLQPLSRLSAVWAAILAVIVIAFLILERKQWKKHLAQWSAAFAGKQMYITLALFALILIQVVWFNLNDETYAIWDQSYYLGDTATSLYTNTISQYNPYTGRILEYLNPEYLLETYQNHGAVMCQLSGLHPMVENLTVMASVVIILYQLIFFEIGRTLFHGNRGKSVLFTAFVFLLNIFSYNLYTAAEFLIIRPSEGKTILAVLIIPAIFCFFLKTVQQPAQRVWWYSSFVIILGSFGLNMSSVFMIPFEITAFYLPLAWKKKQLSIVIRYLLLLLPCILVAAAYILTKDKFLIYTGK
jgi:hypothetical protein